MDFDKISKKFDTDKRKERAGLIASNIRQYIKHDNLSAMEFGCGTGLVGLDLTDLFSYITFIDSSQGMIDEVNRKISHMPNANSICVNLLEEKLSDKTYDYIFTSMAFHHIKNTEDILAILYGLLNDGGTLIIVDLDENENQFHISEPNFDGHNGFDQAQLSILLNNTGFDDIETKTFFKDIRKKDDIAVPYSLFIAKAVKTGSAS